jgi:hypothetical protein
MDSVRIPSSESKGPAQQDSNKTTGEGQYETEKVIRLF